MNVVYFIGAGTSKSIDDRVPVMDDFFEKAIDLIDENVAWITFAAAERARAFPHNPEIENLGIKMGVIGEFLHKNQDGPLKDKLEKELTITRQQYRDAFLADEKRKWANMEDVFSKMEAHKDKNEHANDAYGRFHFLINRLFNKLDKQLETAFLDAPHLYLSEYIKNTDGIGHIFISFNCDLWIEKAFFKKGIWHPRDGHGNYLFGYYLKPEEDDLESVGPKVRVSDKFIPIKPFSNECQKSKVKVLKPHGSLAWRFGKKPGEGVVLVESEENLCVTYNNTWRYPPVEHPDKTLELTLLPLIVPPTPTKIRSHQLFWEIDKDMVKALLTADVVVIIGWSMPDTDVNMNDLISRAINNRTKQIKKLIVCDKDQTTSFYNRFETLFRPQKIEPWNTGFNMAFVKSLEKEICKV